MVTNHKHPLTKWDDPPSKAQNQELVLLSTFGGDEGEESHPDDGNGMFIGKSKWVRKLIEAYMIYMYIMIYTDHVQLFYDKNEPMMYTPIPTISAVSL